MTGLLLSSILLIVSETADTIKTAAVITASKGSDRLEKIASPVTHINLTELKEASINRAKNLSSYIPTLHIPNYGASMTSTIYLRGFGSRMENPVLGLQVDDIPVLDKNAYDFDYIGLRSVTLLRGPQGTLYGRNSMCGLLSLKTLSPADMDGFAARIEYGTANTLQGSLSYCTRSSAFTFGLRRSDGFFDNEYTHEKCDPYRGASFQWKWEKKVNERINVSNLFSINGSSEGAFSYGRYVDGVLLPPSYNDEGSYKRLSVMEGFKARFLGDKVILDGIASIQLLGDDMKMDQDYTPASIFTLEQKQFNKAGTLEMLFRPARKHPRWKPVTGVFGFFKDGDLTAPVLFKREGIEKLILENANRNIPQEIGSLRIPDREFPISSEFVIHTWNAAVYHESEITLGKWLLTAGLRLDYEGGRMNYDNRALFSYQFLPVMKATKPFSVNYQGSLNHHCIELLPKVSVLYPVERKKGSLAFYATVSKGYRAGGFNTQIFSDILQGMMMNGLMADLGVYFDKPVTSAGAGNTEYKPESAWNYELGSRFDSGSGLSIGAGAYVMDCRNQQLTVFPAGQSIGRMMTNAGRSRSCGAELESRWKRERFGCTLAYGWTRAIFLEYKDNNTDYAGKRIPYSPEHTLYASAGYLFKTGSRSLMLEVDLRGTGPIWWNEAGSLRQPFYSVLGSRISLDSEKWSVYLRCENLAGTRYRTFYFKSIGNEFFQRSQPAILAIGINIKS